MVPTPAATALPTFILLPTRPKSLPKAERGVGISSPLWIISQPPVLGSSAFLALPSLRFFRHSCQSRLTLRMSGRALFTYDSVTLVL